MAKIVVHIGHPIADGEKITFKAPVNSGSATGIKVYSATSYDDATEISSVYTIKDANGEDLSETPGLFSTGAYVTVALDTTNNYAYIHNAVGLAVPDGKKWTPFSMPTQRKWADITWGNGTFVAVGFQTTSSGVAVAAISADGINWTEYPLPRAMYNGIKIAYGNGKFVILEAYDVSGALYSTDGITWSSSTLPFSDSWSNVAWGNGKFVALRSSANKGAYSEDGINWTQMSMPSTKRWKSITWGNGKFVAFPDAGSSDGHTGSDVAAYSEDGINWTQVTLPVAAKWSDVTWGNGRFVAIARSRDEQSGSSWSSYGVTTAVYSDDGINWTQIDLPATAFWNRITWGNGKFIALANQTSSSTIKAGAYSTDGIDWVQMDMPRTSGNGNVHWEGVTWGNGMFVAVDDAATNICAYSRTTNDY